MKMQKFTIAGASLERSPGQEADIVVGNLVDERHGGPEARIESSATRLAAERLREGAKPVT